MLHHRFWIWPNDNMDTTSTKDLTKPFNKWTIDFWVEVATILMNYRWTSDRRVALCVFWFLEESVRTSQGLILGLREPPSVEIGTSEGRNG